MYERAQFSTTTPKNCAYTRARADRNYELYTSYQSDVMFILHITDAHDSFASAVMFDAFKISDGVRIHLSAVVLHADVGDIVVTATMRRCRRRRRLTAETSSVTGRNRRRRRR